MAGMAHRLSWLSRTENSYQVARSCGWVGLHVRWNGPAGTPSVSVEPRRDARPSGQELATSSMSAEGEGDRVLPYTSIRPPFRVSRLLAADHPPAASSASCHEIKRLSPPMPPLFDQARTRWRKGRLSLGGETAFRRRVPRLYA
jgi:hypothetical protein